ncbi:integrase, partial [Providencia alcalifaciens]
LRYAHLTPDHLAKHAKQIDTIFNAHVPNTSQMVRISNATNT